jgi:hypothetical protein
MKAIKEKTDANLKEIIEDMRTWQKDMKADWETMASYPEKIPEVMKSVVEHE